MSSTPVHDQAERDRLIDEAAQEFPEHGPYQRDPYEVGADNYEGPEPPENYPDDRAAEAAEDAFMRYYGEPAAPEPEAGD